MSRYVLHIFPATAVTSTGCSKSETTESVTTEGAMHFPTGMNDCEVDWIAI